MAQFKELYRNIEITIDIEPRVQRSSPEPVKLLDLIIRVYPVGRSTNEAEAVIIKRASIADGVKFYDFTEKNAGQLFTCHVFHNSIGEIAQWLDEWNHKEYRQVIMWYLQSKMNEAVN